MVCSCTQLFIRLSYTIIIYKKQGLTLLKIVLDLSRIEYYFRLLYIIISRVKILDGLLFESFFNFDYFKKSKIIISEDRDLDYIFRTNQIL
jgi:hypothetical protein